ncbi:hypothetical protein D3C85_1096010 [compost metagenome]
MLVRQRHHLVAGRQQAQVQHRQLQLGRRCFADDAGVTRRDIVQVGDFVDQVGFGQTETAVDLFQVHAAADALRHALQDLLVDALVDGVVVFRDLNQLAVAHHVDEGARRFQALLFSGGQVLEIAGAAGIVQLLDLVYGHETLEQVLVQRGGVAMAVERTAVDGTVGLRLAQALATGVVAEVDGREEAGTGDTLLFRGGAEVVPLHAHFRVVLHRLRDGVLQFERKGCGRDNHGQ